MTATTIRVQMAQRKDTAANWTAANPILLSGEIGYETDTKKFKIGDGTTNWNSLAYLPIPDGSGNLTITGNLEIGSTGSLTFEGSTADGFETTLAVTNPTADRTITLPDRSGTVITSGDTGTVTSTMLADGTIVDGDVSATAEIAVSKLANGTANQVIVTDGTNVSWSDNLTLAGDLTVNGTTTTINTQDLLVEDKNIIIGNVDTPTDVTADGGGITLKGTTDKTINWVDATDAWTSSERFSIPLGSAAAPSLTFAGDPNTGIYSPGADQVAISTNGTGRLFVDANGNIGAGVSAPQRNLHVAANVFGANLTGGIRLGDAGNNYYLDQLITTDGSSNPYVDLKFATHTLSRYAYGGGNNYWEFYTNNSPAMRLDSSGRLGLGTSAPWSTFTVGSGGTANPAATATIHQNTHSEYRLKLTSSTHNADGNWLGLGFGYSDNYLKAGIIAEAKDGNARTNLHFCLDGNANSDNAGLGDSKMVITYGGNVGIGTNSPTGILEACGSSSYFRPAGAAGTFFQVTAGAANGDVTLTASANSGGYPPLVFSVGGGEAARIDASKRLLVGTSTARANFFNSSVSAISQVEEVGGGSAAYSAITNVAGATGPAFVLGKTRGTSAGSNTVVNSGDQLGTLSFQGSDGSEFVEGAIIRAEVDGTPGANDMPGRLVFSVSQDGSASPTERLRITSDAYVRLASGTGGIQFNGDTAAANALDDYEEGTWTPAVIGSTTAGTATYSTQNGRYTKIGNIVHFELFVAYTGGTGAGNLRIDGLPFAPSISNATYTAVTIGYLNSISLSANHTPLFLCASGDSYIYNYQVPSGGGTNIPIPYSGSGSIVLSGTYTTG